MSAAPPPGPIPIPKDAIKTLFGSLVGLQTYWSWEPRPLPGTAGASLAFMVVSLTGSRSKGVDDYREQYNAVTDAIDWSIGGYRVLTISCRAFSLDSAAIPYDMLERVRWGLRTASAHASLVAAGLAFVRVHPIALFESRADSRTMMNGNMDVELGWVALATQVGDPNGIIETVDTATGGIVPLTLTT